MIGNVAMLAVALALLSAGVVLLLLPALLERRARARSRAEFDLAVYADQLAEIARDLDRGVIGEQEATAAKAEIERRMLRAAEEAGVGEEPEPITHGLARPAAWIAAVAVPVAALIVYLGLGSPTLPDMPLAARVDMPTGQIEDRAEFEDLTRRLAERLEQQPGDPLGWTMLGRSYRLLGRFDDAVHAFERGLSLTGARGGADILADLGEALIYQARGVVTPKALEHLHHSVSRSPGQPKARHYLAVARAQSGDLRGALAIWRGLEEDAPDDAPWLPTVQDRIAEVSMQLGVTPDSIEPQRFRAGASPALAGPIAGDAQPDGDTVAAIEAMDPEARDAMIRGMVDRLAGRLEESPDDIDGWVRLGRAYFVLGEIEQADAALDRAVNLLIVRRDYTEDGSPERAEIDGALDALMQMRETAGQ